MKYDELVTFFDSCIAKIDEFDRKGKSMPYTSANGYMFSQINKDGQLGIRLGKADYQHFHQEHNDQPFMSYNAVMREYVCIPENLLNDESFIIDLLKKGYAHVMSLPPK